MHIFPDSPKYLSPPILKINGAANENIELYDASPRSSVHSANGELQQVASVGNSACLNRDEQDRKGEAMKPNPKKGRRDYVREK
jgi:hypothetical protein